MSETFKNLTGTLPIYLGKECNVSNAGYLAEGLGTNAVQVAPRAAALP
jgi:hypothetical protein